MAKKGYMIAVSNGEIIDKSTILAIKISMVKDELKLGNIRTEILSLQDIVKDIKSLTDIQDDVDNLFNVNLALWHVEDMLRQKELDKEFDEEFILLARNVYFHNDERARLKNIINEKTGSVIVEEKDYVEYK